MVSTLQIRTCPTTTMTTVTFIPDPSLQKYETIPTLAQELIMHLTRRCSKPDTQVQIATRYHNYKLRPEQCCLAVLKHITALIQLVWNLLKQSDQPQSYKDYLNSNNQVASEGNTERIQVLDEESFVLGFHVTGLWNYRSVTTVHPYQYVARRAFAGESINCIEGAVVLESYVVDVPTGSTKPDTCVFIDTIARCNLESLANAAEEMLSLTVTGSSISSAS